MIEHHAFFGDGEKVFAFPTRELIEELERTTGNGIGALFRRFRTSEYSFAEIIHVLRLGLIGGGTLPAAADQLVAIYCIGRPMAETFAVADGVITALFFGNAEPEPEDDFDAPLSEVREAAASGDLSAAINAACEGVVE
jgi:hypothetical protein